MTNVSQKIKIIKYVDFNELSTIKERLKAIEGANLYDVVKAVEICLVLKVVVVPKNHKVL
jgi:hypothetical protein